MKKISFTLLVALIATVPLITKGQKEDQFNNGIGIGIHVNQSQNDFGLGLNLTSPYFVGQRLALRARGNIMYGEYAKNGTTTWANYSNLSLGLVGVAGYVGNSIRLYGEGGFIGLFPSNNFSTKNWVAGGYGLFGFEFFMNKSSNYFLEVGGIGTGAKKELISNKPIYSNGLLINAGFRFHLK